MGKCDLPGWVMPTLPARRKSPRKGRRQPAPAMAPHACWPFPLSAKERAKGLQDERRRARIEAAGGEAAYREGQRARKAALIARNYAAFIARLSPEEFSARMGVLGKKGRGVPWKDREAQLAHLARLGRANITAYNAKETAEQRAARLDAIAAGQKRRRKVGA